MFISTINQVSIMFRYSLIITFLLIVKSQKIPKHYFCPKNLLLCLQNCLYECDHILITNDDIDRIKCRIKCAKENYCKRIPWDLLNKKMKLARKYTKCMIGCEVYLQNISLYGEHIRVRDAECRKIFAKIPAILNKPQNCSIWSG